MCLDKNVAKTSCIEIKLPVACETEKHPTVQVRLMQERMGFNSCVNKTVYRPRMHDVSYYGIAYDFRCASNKQRYSIYCSLGTRLRDLVSSHENNDML